MSIRYDKKLNREINRTIKNFNQKIARLEKYENELLPSKISKKELKENYYTRTELKRKLKELQRFSKRGAEDIIETKSGIRITKYELNNLKRENKRIKQILTHEINRLKIDKPKIFGKEQSGTFAQMGDIEYLNKVARRKAIEKDIELLNSEDFERFKKLIRKTVESNKYMNNMFKENYFKMLTDLGYYFKYDNEKLDKLKEKLMNLKSNDFLKLFKDDKSIRVILDYYPVVTDTFRSINPDDIKHDVITLYDNLIDNIDEIVKGYA